MRKISAEMPSNPQQNQRGMESNASLAMDVGTMAGPACVMPAAADCLGGIVMRAVSFFGPGWIETEAKFSAGGGRNRRGGVTGVVSGLWGSALRTLSFGGSAITNQVAPGKIAENSFVVTR